MPSYSTFLLLSRKGTKKESRSNWIKTHAVSAANISSEESMTRSEELKQTASRKTLLPSHGCGSDGGELQTLLKWVYLPFHCLLRKRLHPSRIILPVFNVDNKP